MCCVCKEYNKFDCKSVLTSLLRDSKHLLVSSKEPGKVFLYQKHHMVQYKFCYMQNLGNVPANFDLINETI